MTNLFLVPAVNERARENFELTVRRPVPAAALRELGPAARKLMRSRRSGLAAWGTKPGENDTNVGTWLSMRGGDWVLFYFDGFFPVCARVLRTEHSPAVATQLWGEDAGATWEYMYLLDQVRQVDIPRLPALRKLGYRPSYHPRRFSRVARDLDRDFGGVVPVLEELAAIGQDFHAAIDAFGSDDDAAAVPAIDRLDRMSEKALLESLARYVASKPPAERREIIRRFKRNLKLVRDLKRLYEDKCQVCGFTFDKNGGGRYSEAAHLDRISLRKADLDVKDNVVILCPNHHKMLDHGPLRIEFDPAKNKLYAVRDGRRKAMTNKHVGL